MSCIWQKNLEIVVSSVPAPAREVRFLPRCLDIQFSIPATSRCAKLLPFRQNTIISVVWLNFKRLVSKLSFRISLWRKKGPQTPPRASCCKHCPKPIPPNHSCFKFKDWKPTEVPGDQTGERVACADAIILASHVFQKTRTNVVCQSLQNTKL